MERLLCIGNGLVGAAEAMRGANFLHFQVVDFFAPLLGRNAGLWDDIVIV